MTKLQFRVLYREFLFRMVDLELLSAHAQGDSSKLLGRFASLLLFLSLLFTAPVMGMNARLPPQGYLILEWSMEHFLISTTMLVVGLFAVLSWDSTFPNRRDVLVLAPLPVRSSTFFLAKVAAVGTALLLTIGALHVLAGLAWPTALNKKMPALMLPALVSDPVMPPVDAAGMKAVLDRDFERALRSGNLAPGTGAGAAIGVYTHGTRRVFAYGAAKPDSLFEIGSATKTFTGLALAQMVRQGKVRLDEPVRELLPAGTVAKPYGAEITLLDLAMHHSGLPREASSLGVRAPELYKELASHGVRKPAESRFMYSNLGLGLLGQALAVRAGTSWAELVQQQVTGPLGLKDTVTSLSEDQRARFMQGYDSTHRPVPELELHALAGAGALRSTAGDMLTYLEAQLHPERFVPQDGGAESGHTLADALRMSHVLRADMDSDGGHIALVWWYFPASGNYFHGGTTYGQTAYAAFNPQADTAAVVLCNTGGGSDVSADVLGVHVNSRLTGKTAVSIVPMTIPASRGKLGDYLRSFLAYWVTMLAAGGFIFCCVLGVQGLAAQLLPRRLFLRASSALQLTAFSLFVSIYFMQPILATPDAVLEAQSQGLLSWSPSYWFLGLFQRLNGSPAMAKLADRACVALAIAVATTAVAYALSYFRTLRKIVEEPDILPGARGVSRLPRFCTLPQTAIVQFSIRTLMRSRQHRVILAFYLGMGFAMTIFLVRSPAFTSRILDTAAAASWREVSIPILASTLVMTIFWVAGTRVLFSLPMDMQANWLFRLTAWQGAQEYLAAARRSLLVLSVAPLLLGTAVLCFALWPWRAAATHVAALGLLGLILADCLLRAFRKIPFTCSYLPGKSQVHMMILGALCLMYFSLFAVKFEQEVLASAGGSAKMLLVLLVLALCARWRSVAFAKSEAHWLRFEDMEEDEIQVLGLAQPDAASEEPVEGAG
jgi:CubicO group peptidase (beta-lactamase class C family)